MEVPTLQGKRDEEPTHEEEHKLGSVRGCRAGHIRHAQGGEKHQRQHGRDPKGTASDTHHTSIHAAALSTATCPSGMPKDDVATHVTAANAGPNTCLIAEAFMDARIARPRVYLPSMELDLYRVDAFTERFWGQSCVRHAAHGLLEDEVLLALAQENAVAETAFLVQKAGTLPPRWFTPDVEMDLCGHATLASAHVVLTYLEPEAREVCFESASGVSPSHGNRLGTKWPCPTARQNPPFCPWKLKNP